MLLTYQNLIKNLNRLYKFEALRKIRGVLKFQRLLSKIHKFAHKTKFKALNNEIEAHNEVTYM